MSGVPVTVGPEPMSIPKRHDALIVLDVDEVVLHFIEPYAALLEEFGARLHVESFHLTGNVRSISTGAAISGHELNQISIKLYEEQESRQLPVDGVQIALDRLSKQADIVFLTAMTPSFYPQRRRLLDAAALPFPMIATERAKGGVVAELGEIWRGPIVFADDLPLNLVSVARSLPRARLVHLMANHVFRLHLPELPKGVAAAGNWQEAEAIIFDLLRSN